LTLLDRVGDPKIELAEELVSLRAPSSLEADLYRTLRQTVERMHRETGLRVLAVTSATPGDGKTLTSLNLAGSLAQTRGSRVLVIDADLHQPAVADYLGLPPPFTMGLADLIENEKSSLSQAVIRLESVNLSVLPAGDTSEAFGMLASTRLDTLIAEARRTYDYVIVDTPPVVPLADCRLLERCVDGFLLVVVPLREDQIDELVHPRRLRAGSVGLRNDDLGNRRHHAVLLRVESPQHRLFRKLLVHSLEHRKCFS